MSVLRYSTEAAVKSDLRQKYYFSAGTKALEFFLANNFVDFIQGDLGSGKTVALCLRVMRHIQEQRPSPISGKRMSRWAFVRNTTPDLKRTTIRTWLNIVPESLHGRFNMGQTLCHMLRFTGADGIPIECDVDFIGLDKDDDVKKLRSTEYTGVAFNELPYIPKVLFDEATGRLRYPPTEHGGPTWRGMVADGNAPEEDCWLALMTGQIDLPPGMTDQDAQQYKWPVDWGFYKQPPALLETLDDRGNITGYTVNPAAENLKNLPPDYYEKAIAGKSKAWIDSHLRNTVTLVVEGSPVWPMFRREYHVTGEALKPLLDREVIVALDFGRVYPAALFAQEINGRVNVQYEMLGFNEGATIFAPKVKRFLETHYPGCTFRCVGDPKGADKGQATEQSAYDVFKFNGMPVTPAPVKQNDIAQRLEAVAFILNDNPSGVNRLVISPYNRTLIVGMAGRYHLVREENGELKPKKDKYSNLCDCLQYLCISLGEGRRMMGLKAVGEQRGMKVYKGRSTMRRVSA
ncbi:MAG: hypothetical protein ABIO35_08215 [Nitrobacter sp.]